MSGLSSRSTHQAHNTSARQYFRDLHPQLALRDYGIAEAAAKAGFDCGSWLKLKGLIDAVRLAENPPYPDSWSDTGASISSICPDRYRAELQRARKGVAQAYRDVDRAFHTATVPAFVVPAKQLLNYIRCEPETASKAIDSSYGRIQEDLVGLAAVSKKRLKTEGSSNSQKFSQAHPSSYIDLTQDETFKKKLPKTETNRPSLATISNNITQPGPSKVSRTRKRQREEREQQQQPYKPIVVVEGNRAAAAQRVQPPPTTRATITKIANRLHAIAANINEDRDTLRQRWEDDPELKTQVVTNDLAQLNECFTRAEEAVLDGIGIIQERLLGGGVVVVD